MSLEPGQRLAHYRIERKIGEGGMGVVYLAEDTRLGRKVALKVLPVELSSDADRRARFQREARAVAALNHPNIVTIHSVEEQDGLCFLTMEMVEGQPLSHLFAAPGMATARLLDLSIGIAEALVVAHRQGVVHRDLKPDNIMVTPEGRVKVLDFGLAKLREPADQSSNTVMPTKSITEEGKIIGTVAYMSPEQAEGKPLDHRSDIFSFGIVLYEMATARRPFRGDTAISTISSILKDTPPPPQQINAALPAEIGRIVRRCLSKEPARRYQSTDDLRNELRDLKDESDSGVLTAERAAVGVVAGAGGRATGRPGRAVLLGSAALMVVLAAGAGWLLTRRGTAPAPAASLQPLQMRRATTDGRVEEATISPDGRYLAYVRREKDLYALRLRQVLTGDEVQVVAPSTMILTAPAFSPDGNFLTYVSVEPGKFSGSAQRVSVLGGAPRRIVEGVAGLRPSPDGHRLAVLEATGEESSLSLTGPEGEDRRVLVSRKGRDHFDTAPAWSSDGKTLAIVSHRFGEPQKIVLVDTGSGGEQVLPSTRLRSVGDVAWIPGKQALLVAGSETPANQFGNYQVWEVSMAGDAEPITRDLNDYLQVAVTADGATMATVQVTVRTGIAIAPLRGGVPGTFSDLLPISDALPGRSGIAWLHGGRLAHSMVAGETEQIVVTDPASKSSRVLTSGPSHDNPVISRDGRVLVANKDDGDHSNLWRVDPESGREERLTSGDFDREAVVSRDGAWVVFSSVGDHLSLSKVPGAGGTPVELFARRIFCSEFSPDDRDLLCVRFDAADRPEWVLVPLAGGEPRLLEGIPEQARVARFGSHDRSITWLVNQGGSGEIWSLPEAGGKARLITRLQDTEVRNYLFAPDGSHVAVVKGSRSGDVVLLSRPRP